MTLILIALALFLFLAVRCLTTTLSGRVGGSLGFTYDSVLTGLSDTSNPTTFTKQVQYSTGSGSGQASKVFAQTRTVNANSSETLNFTNGSLTDPLNQAISATGVKAVFCWNVGTSDTLPDGTAGTGASSMTVTGFNGTVVQGGFLIGTTPGFRVFGGANGGMTQFTNPGATGVNTNINAVVVTNEDAVNQLTYVLALLMY